MSRRASLPGADELFRRTSGATEVESEPLPDAVSSPESTSSNAAVLVSLAVVDDSEQVPAGIDGADAGLVRRAPVRRRTKSGADRKSTGRERHDEKITVYVSPEELVDLEQAKLVLRAQHGLAIDRGRIVREAISVVIADLDAKGEESILVRRLRGL